MATNDFIKVDRTTPAATHSGLLLQYIAAVRQAYDLSKRIQGIMDHNNNGADFANMEALFGLPTGSGAVVLAAVAGAVRDADAKALTERIG